jgi:hypothetical protein
LKVAAKYDPDGMSAELIRLIENGVAPDSWVSRGGPGRIDYNPELKTIFVTNTGEVLEDVAALIQARRRELQLRKERCEEEVREAEMKSHGRWGKLKPEEIDELAAIQPNLAAGSEAYTTPTAPKIVDLLLQESREALLEGKQERAEMLARCALSIDRKAVMEHPLVYKMQLLAQVMSAPAPVQLQPRIPGVDPNVVRAYNEILEMGPKAASYEASEMKTPAKPVSRKKAAKEPDQMPILEVNEEPCELEILSEEKPANSCCVDIDLTGKRLRFQVQVGAWTLKVSDESKDHLSLSVSLRLNGKPAEEAEGPFWWFQRPKD